MVNVNGKLQISYSDFRGWLQNELNKQFIYNRYHTFVVSSEHGRYNQYIEELNVNFK